MIVKLKTVSERIQLIRRILNKSREQFATEIGIPYNTLLCWENGRVNLSLKGAKRIVEGLKKIGVPCTYTWLLHGDVVSELEQQDIVKQMLFMLKTNICHELSLNSDIETMVINDAMIEFAIGDYLIGEYVNNKDLIGLLGHPVMYKSEKNEVMVRLLYPSNEIGFYTLICSNFLTQVRPFLIENVKQPIARITKHCKGYKS